MGMKQRWTWELQAERRRNERPPIDWDTMRRAILLARGAKECAVEAPASEDNEG